MEGELQNESPGKSREATSCGIFVRKQTREKHSYLNLFPNNDNHWLNPLRRAQRSPLMQLIQLSILKQRGGSKGREWILKDKRNYSTFKENIILLNKYSLVYSYMYVNIYIFTYIIYVHTYVQFSFYTNQEKMRMQIMTDYIFTRELQSQKKNSPLLNNTPFDNKRFSLIVWLAIAQVYEILKGNRNFQLQGYRNHYQSFQGKQI